MAVAMMTRGREGRGAGRGHPWLSPGPANAPSPIEPISAAPRRRRRTHVACQRPDKSDGPPKTDQPSKRLRAKIAVAEADDGETL